MKSKYKSFKKQGIKIFTRTISIMFLFGIIVYGVYAYITLNNEKQIQQTHSNEMFLEFLDEVNTCYNTYNSLQHTIQSNSDNNTKIKYYEKSLVFKRHKEPTYESSNCLPFTFANETGVSTENYTGIIEYESFRNSISDEDYQEIYEYIHKKPDEKDFNSRYTLSCSECIYGYKNTESPHYTSIIYPTKLEVLKINDNIDWYDQAEKVKEYILDQSYMELSETRTNKVGKTYLNEIAVSFFDGIFYQSCITDEEIDTVFDNTSNGQFNSIYDAGEFNYIYYNTFNENYNVEMADNITQNYTDRFCYFHKYNILSECSDELITMMIYILTSFTTMGILIAFMSWHTLKKQIMLEEKRRELTNSMAHDLKTPLFVISGYAENLLENVHTDKKDHYAQMIYDKANELNGMVHNMLELSKLESNSFNPQKEEFDLVSATKEILLQFNGSNNFNILLEGIDKANITADKDLIKRAISNFIQNADKYSENKQAIIDISSNKFKISNQCTKIKANEVKRLWEPYYVGENSVRNNGNGLGLSIVKNIMQAHNFDFGAELENDKIVFYFTF